MRIPPFDDGLAPRRRALVVPAEASEPEGRGRVGGDVHVLGAVAQAAQVAGLQEARAGVRGLGAVDPVELGGMADRFVNLEHHLLGVDHDRGDARRAGVGSQERGGLLADPRRLAVEAELLDVLPAALAARATVRARIAAVLDSALVRDGQRVDPAAALDEALRDPRALGRVEDAALAHRADVRLGDLHLGPAHALLCAEAEGDLLLERHLDRVSLDLRFVVTRGGRHRSEFHARARARGARAGERDRPQRRVARALLGGARVAREAPGSVDQDAHADALGLGVGHRVDLAVLRGDVLGAAPDDARVRVAGPGGEGGIECVVGELVHGPT